MTKKWKFYLLLVAVNLFFVAVVWAPNCEAEPTAVEKNGDRR